MDKEEDAVGWPFPEDEDEEKYENKKPIRIKVYYRRIKKRK